MEQSREQPPGAAPYPHQVYPQPAPRPSAWRVFSSFCRMLFRRLIYVIVLVLRPLRNRIGTSILTIALLGVIGFLAFNLYGPKTAAAPDKRSAAVAPAPAVENYMTGRKSFDADLMWEAFSSDFQARQLQNGGSKATWKSNAEQEKRLGFQYREIQYVGAVKRTGNNSGFIYYYSVDLIAGAQTYRAPIIFYTNSDGKIEILISKVDDIIQQLTQ